MTRHDAQQQQAEQLVSDILGPRTRDCDGAYNEYVQLIAHALREAEQRVWEEAAIYLDEGDILESPDELDARCKCQCFGILGRISNHFRRKGKQEEGG